MFGVFKRKQIEIRTVHQMIKIYCKAHHDMKNSLCDSCQEIYDYAIMKYEKCPFGANKPVCSKCKIHCYQKDKREHIKTIMRYSGPRMLFQHPINTLIYLYHKYTYRAKDWGFVKK